MKYLILVPKVILLLVVVTIVIVIYLVAVLPILCLIRAFKLYPLGAKNFLANTADKVLAGLKKGLQKQ